MDTQSQPAKTIFLPIIGLFVFVSSLLWLFKPQLDGNGINTTVLLAGNVFLFVLFMISTWLQRNAMMDKSTQIFLRNVYGGILLKLFGGATAAFIYIYIARDNVNKPALFGTMFLYMLYTIIELRVVLKKTKSS
ncbi:hypothetical protein [Flavihumibacter fluvii]|uniref:hypothetical protein n=1 Tax=Flavihumibacter fluvii TaxID=2838157 RepID=UPI001BDEB06B|nr:hypothetical protein [Flavihumibacter fluvii]ULQ53489.1 hypothetical protein KJS93_04035 [Flavihumibacter fluvii]